VFFLSRRRLGKVLPPITVNGVRYRLLKLEWSDHPRHDPGAPIDELVGSTCLSEGR
jgi:hypothetical protein